MNSQKQQDHRNLQPTSYDGFRTLSIAPRLHLFNIGLHNRSDESYHWQPSNVRGWRWSPSLACKSGSGTQLRGSWCQAT